MNLSRLGGLLEQAPQYQQLKKSLGNRATLSVQAPTEAAPYFLATLWRDLKTPVLVIAPRPEDARRLHEQLATWATSPPVPPLQAFGEGESGAELGAKKVTPSTASLSSESTTAHAPPSPNAWRGGTGGEVAHFPETETLPFERLATDVDTVHQRLRVLAALVGYGVQESSNPVPPIVVASASAVVQKTIDRETFVSSTHALRRGQTIALDDLLEQWRRMGYQFEPAVYSPGFASRRGGILDIYPVGAALPARIELWGNEIDSIRLFDPASQRSTDMVDSIVVVPAQETLPAMTSRGELDRLMAFIDVSNCTRATQERIREEFNLLLDGYEVEDLNFYAGFFNRGSLLDYFPRDGLLVIYRPTDVAQAAWDTEERAHELREAKEGRGELPLNFPSSYLTWRDVEEQLSAIAKRLDVSPWGTGDEGLGTGERLTPSPPSLALPFSAAPAFLGKLDGFAREVRELTQTGHRVVAVTSHSKRLGEILAGHGIGVELPASLEGTPPPGSATVLQSEGAGLRDGFVLSVNGVKLAVFSDAEVFGVAKQRRAARRPSAKQREAFLAELAPGDYVVHVEHGIGKFIGTGRLPKDEGGGEYLIVQYAQGDKLYVPMEHLDRLSRYIATMDQPPSLTRLGTQEWDRTKERVERSTREMAAELLSLYAARELAEGHAFGPDTPWQQELEDSFPYEETPDQLATIAEVKADMEAPRPMDRLVCGDVGYGKTEIALRAAFKAVMEGKQVAVLVPTTVLAQQHYATFSQRLSAYPVAVEVLSRFRTDKEQGQIIERLAAGKIDICVGTHRLIQKDVRFKDLGLVIVDEEQRFGVTHKERLKQMRREVDVLTLTATPIPRTLHMALAGIRDMSTMETPPEERLPIKTYVSEFSNDLIREAILRELDRQGQVYFLHNRVHSIEYMAEYVGRLVPEATVGIAHGQMPEGELEQAMLDFAEGNMDVLVCTTIIESGLDIPNVNTLIVDRADTFGLAQLYQLRGRVGRSSRRAYAYLLIPQSRSLTETAEKRLKAMLSATELGAGFRIAMKDLEIRGAGNILGAEQSGHIHAVGFDLYTRLLANAVEELRSRGTGYGIQGRGLDGQASGAEIPGSVPTEARTPYPEPRTPEVTIDLGIPASVPEDYIPDLPTRIGIYQRMIRLASLEEINEVEDELRDRFGPLPWQTQNLLYVVRLRMHAQRAGIETISREGQRIVLRFKSDLGGARRALQRLLGQGAEIGNTQVRLELDGLTVGWEKPLLDAVSKLAEFAERMAAGLATAVR